MSLRLLLALLVLAVAVVAMVVEELDYLVGGLVAALAAAIILGDREIG